MNNLKFVTCSIINIFLLTIFLQLFKSYSENKQIVTAQKPITVKILDVTYRAKSASTCKVEFNGKTYENISLPKRVTVGKINQSDFFYNSLKNCIFIKNEGIGALYVTVTLFFLSIFLWFIPKDKFK